MRYLLIALSMLFSVAASAATQVSIFIGQPTVSIGVRLPVYPELVRVPGYPVYYAPRVNANIFFYDGLYWVYTDDRWYASSWYNGPWGLVDPDYVPVYVLRVPVRYYRQPPTYFRAWAVDAPPRWGEYWGATWEQRRSGWDRWNRSSVPAAAPLPVYQRQYSGDRYPRVEQQRVILNQQYRYQPRDTAVRQYYTQVVQTSVAPAQKRQATQSTAVTQRQVTQTAAATQSTSAQHSAAQFAPGQVKNQQGAQSAKEFAPGQVKRQQGAQSAKEFAPGQVKKQQAAQTTAMAPVTPMTQQVAPAPRPNENAKGRGKGKGNDEGEDQGRGESQGQGQGRGHGKGHGKD